MKSWRRDLPAGKLWLKPVWRYDNEVWHEETVGIWHLLRNRDRLYVINDQAESVNCLDAEGGRILWRAATSRRPTGAVIWADRLVVCSAQAGVVEAYRLDNGGRIWSKPVAPGLSRMIQFDKRLVITNRILDRLHVVDPLDGGLVSEVKVPGAPNAIYAADGKIHVGLDSLNQIVSFDSSFIELKRLNLADGD